MTAGGGQRPAPLGAELQARLADSGALLERLGTGKAVRGGKGGLSGQVRGSARRWRWTTQPRPARSAVATRCGPVPQGRAGRGRLLGVLSLQALPRRLVLDFRDVFQQGFAFDNITGDVQHRAGRGAAPTTCACAACRRWC
jgi:uncharacterized protein YhdP